MFLNIMLYTSTISLPHAASEFWFVIFETYIYPCVVGDTLYMIARRSVSKAKHVSDFSRVSYVAEKENFSL